MGSSGKSSGTTSPLTTKGDVWGWSTTNARIPVGSDTQVLTADSTQALGLKWAAAPGVTWPLTNSADETFQPNSVASNTLTLHNNASAVNGVTVTGTTTGNPPTINATGSDTNLGLSLNSKGSGTVKLATGGSGAGITITDAGPTTLFQGNGSSTVFKDTAGNTILTVVGSSSPTNGLTITSSNTGFAVLVAVTGGDTNQGLAIDAKGTGALTLNATGTGVVTLGKGTQATFTAASVASQVNGVTLNGTATGTDPTLVVSGDANRGLVINPAGTGTITVGGKADTGVPLTVAGNSTTQTGDLLDILQNPGGNALFKFATASAGANGITFAAQAAGTSPTITAAGADTNIDLILNAKSAGIVRVGNTSTGGVTVGGASQTAINLIVGAANTVSLKNGAATATLAVAGVASLVNGVTVTGAVTTVAPSIAASGTDTNVDLTINGKGTGVINYGYASTAISGAAAPATLAITTGGATGPATAGQNAWLAVKINGTTSYIPFWR